MLREDREAWLSDDPRKEDMCKGERIDGRNKEKDKVE
jgi:hypothetical protein